MILEEKKVGEFVLEDYRNAHLFSKHGIEFLIPAPFIIIKLH